MVTHRISHDQLEAQLLTSGNPYTNTCFSCYVSRESDGIRVGSTGWNIGYLEWSS